MTIFHDNGNTYNYDDLTNEVERLRWALNSASEEILRLETTIRQHTTSASNAVVTNYESEAVTVLDYSGMRTEVLARPLQPSFYLAEPLGGWSDDHRRAFHDQVVAGVGHAIANDVSKSIWAAEAAE